MESTGRDPEEIAALYDELIETYEAEWERQGHMSLHMEYYDEDHDEAPSASINTMRVLSEAANIDASDLILNIGCGAGEDSVWNARAYDATVIGVNISETQLNLARQNALEHDVSDLTEFRYDDFHDLETVADDSIDVVWGLEALSHSRDRRQVLGAARRVLAPGGRVAFTDLFFRDGVDVTEIDQSTLDQVNEGLGLHLGAISEFESILTDLGFEDITIEEHTEPIEPCTRRRHRFARIAHPVGRLLRVFSVFSDTQLAAFKASSLLHKLIESDQLGYYVITASPEKVSLE
jgi:tocopherol O-methyltransferase